MLVRFQMQKKKPADLSNPWADAIAVASSFMDDATYAEEADNLAGRLANALEAEIRWHFSSQGHYVQPGHRGSKVTGDRLVIAGSRRILDGRVLELIEEFVTRAHITPSEVVCGGAMGVDGIGETWAVRKGIPVTYFYPDYVSFDRAVAPLIRNTFMAKYGDVLLAVWDGQSTGTMHMVSQMRQARKSVELVQLDLTKS